VDASLPLGCLIAITGACGSGSRAFAVDVVAAESRRRYLLALSPAEREGLGGMNRVRVDEIIGLPPAVYLDGRQEHTWRPRPTVAAALGLDVSLATWLQARAEIRCPDCGGGCCSYTPEKAVETALARLAERQVTVLAPLPLAAATDPERVFSELRRAGFVRLRRGTTWIRLDDEAALNAASPASGPIEVVVDRVPARADQRSRLLEAVRQARAIGRGDCVLAAAPDGPEFRANHDLTCEACGVRHEVPSRDDFAAVTGRRVPLVGDAFIAGQRLGDLVAMRLDRLRAWLGSTAPDGDPLSQTLAQPAVLAAEMGLGHLCLGDPTARLSQGERQRLMLVSCLGTGLAGLLYVVDGVAAAAGPGEADWWVAALRQLVARGNTVLALDHHPDVVAAADHRLHFAHGTLTTPSPPPARLPHSPPAVAPGSWLVLTSPAVAPLAACQVELPLAAVTCVTGPSGSGKSLFLSRLAGATARSRAPAATALTYRGHRGLSRVVEVRDQPRDPDQTLLDAMGLFDRVCRLYAETPVAVQRGLTPAWFRLDRAGGRCPECEGRGALHLDLGLLEDLQEPCPECAGTRFRSDALAVTWHGLSLADLLALTIDQAGDRLASDPSARTVLQATQQCGLGFHLLGHPCGRLEPGEDLRLRLAVELPRARNRDLFLLDQPAGSDAPDDLGHLAAAVRALVAVGATVVVADNHPQLCALAAWEVRMGPGVGPDGGRVVYAGPPGDGATPIAGSRSL
jgi:excinuclease ABC subunit A